MAERQGWGRREGAKEQEVVSSNDFMSLHSCLSLEQERGKEHTGGVRDYGSVCGGEVGGGGGGATKARGEN